MKEVKLLIVDDDDEIIQEFKKSIEIYNRDNSDIKYKPHIANNFDEAKEKLETYIIDTAIIDINLNNHSGDDNVDGNSVIEEILKYFRMPIFVVSGTPSNLDNKFQHNAMIEVYKRDATINNRLFDEIIPNVINSPTISYFLREGFLEREITEFYWNHLSKTLKHWKQVAEEFSQEEIDKILSRHTLSCLTEKLYVNGNIGRFDEYHFGEMYVIPPIKQHYHTGDIIKKDEELFIILNPSCDIVTKKVEFYLLAKIVSTNTNIDNIKCNKGKEYYYYLPYFANIFTEIPDSVYVINFQNLQTTESCNEYERIATISAPFLKDVIARFSRYYARQGQPNLMRH